MDEQPFDSHAYAIAYRMAVAGGVGHTTAVRHATIVAEAAYDTESVYLAARFAGCTDYDASAAARWERH